MSKIQNFAEITPNLPFSEFNFYADYRRTFEKTELGRIKRLLPLHEMTDTFGLVNKSMMPKRGRKSYFTPEGKVALMFLKMYTQLSAPKLMEQLNGNIHYQIFCDIYINPERPLTNYKLIDDIVSELSGSLKIHQLQDILAKAWEPSMRNLDTMYTDATCHESEMRYPTDQKLLWECCQKAYVVMCRMSERMGQHRPRTKFNDVEKANMGYVKQRKHNKGQTKKMVRRLLMLLGRLLKEIRKMERDCGDANVLTDKEKDVIETVTKAYRPQKEHFDIRRIKARKKATEILYIFFGIHAANVTHLAERLAEQPRAKAA